MPTIQSIKNQIAKIAKKIRILTLEHKVRVYLEKVGLTEKECDLLVAVIYAESGMDMAKIHTNDNGTTDYGICQFNSEWYIGKYISVEDAMYNLEKCLEVFVSRYRSGHLKDWIAYRNKSYLKYLK